MEEDSRFRQMAICGLGAVGLGAVGAAVAFPGVGLWVAGLILLLALLLLGGYYLWCRLRGRRQRDQFTAAVEAQTAAAPRAISDPNQRAMLDDLRQRFQRGLQEYRSRDMDIYKLPWYVIIGESGSGKTEAIRHSGIDFPPGLQDELQGSGGTVNMDWWFTNRGIILDTAGSMVFKESGAAGGPEWREFLRLLRKARPQRPVNGLFLVLSVESLIRDSADRIASKASLLAQQLDLIQRTLDVRFPVYLLVTKGDLLTGFREFFDNLDDPSLQGQIFGWSNPEPLDALFRPDLVDQHLKSIADRLRRRRLALLREVASSSGTGDGAFLPSSAAQPGRSPVPARLLDNVDSLFALPESILRLAPRLRRYLETIFVAGEWSAKPVFLRGIYFTSSMREGKALDEAIALATGLTLDQLPEDRSWEKQRAFFLRDFFLEKVFRESGLVTRAANTLKLLRKRQFTIFGSAGAALLLLAVLAVFTSSSLKRGVRAEADWWNAAATNWSGKIWSPAIVARSTNDPSRFGYGGEKPVPVEGDVTAVKYHERLRDAADNQLPGRWFFRPIEALLSSGATDRGRAQRLVFEGGVIRPLVESARQKMQDPMLTLADTEAEQRHREALKALMRFEADGLGGRSADRMEPEMAESFLKPLLSYVLDEEHKPNPVLAKVLIRTYRERGAGEDRWPPKRLLQSGANPAITNGLNRYLQGTGAKHTGELQSIGELTIALTNYQAIEDRWLTDPQATCEILDGLRAANDRVEQGWQKFQQAAYGSTNLSLTNLTVHYEWLERAPAEPFQGILSTLPDSATTTGLFGDLGKILSEAAGAVRSKRVAYSNDIVKLDLNYLRSPTNGFPWYMQRLGLYVMACTIGGSGNPEEETPLGDMWTKFGKLSSEPELFRKEMSKYEAHGGPRAGEVDQTCKRVIGGNEEQLRTRYVSKYVELATNTLKGLATNVQGLSQVITATNYLRKITADLDSANSVDKLKDYTEELKPVREALKTARLELVRAYAEARDRELRSRLRFPVLINAETPYTSSRQLIESAQWMASLTNELGNAVWQEFPESTEGLDKLRKNPYRQVFGTLVEGDQLAEMEVFFISPEPESENEYIIKVFRVADVRLGDGKAGDSWTDLSKLTATNSLAKGKVDEGITIRFRKLPRDETSEAAGVNESNWGLLRLIKKGEAKSMDDEGKRWRVPVKVEAKETGREGQAVFEVRLKQPLPKKLEDWPKQ